jgi:hypothetical protein
VAKGNRTCWIFGLDLAGQFLKMPIFDISSKIPTSQKHSHVFIVYPKELHDGREWRVIKWTKTLHTISAVHWQCAGRCNIIN